MKNKEKFYSLPLLSTILILFFILVSSTASAAVTDQSASSVKTCAYITNNEDNTVSVIDTATDTVTATVAVGSSPYGIAVSPDGTKVYVANTGGFSSAEHDTVSVINTATNVVTSTVTVGDVNIPDGPYGIAVNPDGTKVYVTNYVNNSLSIIDTAINKDIAALRIGHEPVGVTFNPSGTKAYVVALDYPAFIYVIDTITNIVATLPLDPSSYFGVAVSPDGTKVYVTKFSSVYVIDTTTNTVTSTVNVENGAKGISITPDGSKIYVTGHSNTASVINTTTNTVTATIVVGNQPIGVSITPDGTKAYVVNSGSDTVSVINTTTDTVISTVSVGKRPIGFGQFIGSIPEFEPPLPTLPEANFTSNVTQGYAPLSVQFTNLSENATGLNWDFENDGNTDSTEANPVYVYSAPGIYTVNLTATNNNGTDSKLATITVLEQTLPPVANFTCNATQGYAPLAVQFTALSENTTEWSWNFGDRTYSTDKDPVHTYSKAGRYTVSLTVTNKNGMDTEIKRKYISVSNTKDKKGQS